MNASSLVLGFISILMIGEISLSRPLYYHELLRQFPKVLNTSKCLTCHGSGSEFFNLFGKDVAKCGFTNGRLDLAKVVDLDSNKMASQIVMNFFKGSILASQVRLL